MRRVVKATFKELVEASSEGFDDRLAQFFDLEEELSFEVWSRAQARSAEPPGVLAYISPKRGARVPDGWGAVLDGHNLVWVGAQDSGNEVHVARRAGLALLAPTVASLAGAGRRITRRFGWVLGRRASRQHDDA